jgi:hypothetical protein
MPHEIFELLSLLSREKKSVLALGNNFGFFYVPFSLFLFGFETVWDMHILSGQMTRCTAGDAVWGKVRRT